MKIKPLHFSLFILAIMILSAGGAQATRHTITQTGFSFAPANISNVVTGDTIEWIWTGGTHTTTSKNVPTGATSWDSPLSSSVISFEYIPLVAGEYEYVCTPHESMGMTGKFTVSSSTTGLDGQVISTGDGFSVSPNPACDDYCSLRITANKMGDITVKVFNMLGEQVKVTSLSLTQGSNTRLLDLSGMREGIYFIQLWEKGKKVETQKIVKR